MEGKHHCSQEKQGIIQRELVQHFSKQATNTISKQLALSTDRSSFDHIYHHVSWGSEWGANIAIGFLHVN
jgi:hypothetical protein